MYGNGVAIGLEVIAVAAKPTLKALLQALSALSGAVAGTSAPGTAALPYATSAPRASGATTMASAWLLPHSLCGLLFRPYLLSLSRLEGGLKK